MQVRSETRRVEMACRIHEATTWPGGVCHVHPDAQVEISDPQKLIWKIDDIEFAMSTS